MITSTISIAGAVAPITLSKGDALPCGSTYGPETSVILCNEWDEGTMVNVTNGDKHLLAKVVGRFDAKCHGADKVALVSNNVGDTFNDTDHLIFRMADDQPEYIQLTIKFEDDPE